MDGHTLRTRLRVLALGGALAMLVTAGAAPATASGPAGITVSCVSHADTIPARANGMVYGSGTGRCTVTGDLGAPWYVQMTLKLQAKTGGRWVTRGHAVTWTPEGGAATKRIGGLRASVPCGRGSHKWRIVAITRALVNEKAVTTLKTDTAVSNVKQLAC